MASLILQLTGIVTVCSWTEELSDYAYGYTVDLAVSAKSTLLSGKY